MENLHKYAYDSSIVDKRSRKVPAIGCFCARASEFPIDSPFFAHHQQARKRPPGRALPLSPEVVGLMFFDAGGQGHTPPRLHLCEVADSSLEQQLVRVAGHVLIEADAAPLGVTHLA